MTKIKQSPKLPAAKRREQLLTSARKLFVQKGFRGTTTEEIAGNVGLTKGALYFHFKSKEDILLELIKSITRRNQATLESRLKGKVSPSEFFRVLISMHSRRDLSKRGEIMDIWIQAWRVPRIRRYITRRLRSVLKRFDTQIDPAYVASKERIPELAILIFALVHGLSAMRMLIPGTVDLEAQVELFESLFDTRTKRSRRKGSK